MLDKRVSESEKTTRSFVMRAIAVSAAVAFGFLFVCTDATWAAEQIVKIYDLTEGMPTATVDEIPVTPMSGSTDDYLHFQFQSNWTWAFPWDTQVSRDLTEPGSMLLSDRLLVTLNESQGGMIDVRFDSRDPILIPQANSALGSKIWDSLEETGQLQYMFQVAGQDGAGQNQFATFFASSDVDVPEPSTILLLGIGAISVVLCAWRKH
jgi:hypothetical protein